MDAIRIESLTCEFGPIKAVDHLTLSVSEGEIFGLVGPDGAGKTTTMRLLTAILNPTSGDAWVAGKHIVHDSEVLKDDIGYMSQKFGLYSDLSVIENIYFYADIYGVSHRARDKQIERLLGFSNLKPFKNRLAGNLSGGMKQKLGLACALIHKPKVLFLDEPTNGVDPVSRRDFWRILYQLLREKVTIFISTAYLDEAERANRIALVHKGQLLAYGTPDEVKKLMKDTIFEIRTTEPRRAFSLLQDRNDRGSIGLFGDRIHLAIRDCDNIDQIAPTLKQVEISVLAVRPIEPSIEDVFISVVEHTLPTSSHRATFHNFSQRDLATEQAWAMENIVVIQDLEKRFGDFTAVNRISFQVRRGEIFGFLGPNGAGKSTTIRMLCGVLTPSSGIGIVGGFDINTQAEQIKANIGYMSQKFSLYEDLTVEENIDFYAGIYRVAPEKKRERKEWVLEMAGLNEHRRRCASVLSGGWKQRLALGCAILHEPPILFLDEPTSGVDPISRRQFWDLIYYLSSRGVTIFVTTHYMDEAEYCDRLGLIYRGNLIALGSPHQIKAEYAQDEILEIECEHPQEALAILETLSGVKDVAMFGKGLHVITLNSDLVLPTIHTTLAHSGLKVIHAEKIAPSLEDVFISLIEAHDCDHPPQQEVVQ